MHLNLGKWAFPPIKGIEQTIDNFRVTASGRAEECLIAINPKGTIVAGNIGKATSVEVPRNIPGCFIAHSHPNSSAPLSIPDLMVIPCHQLTGNMSTCTDGTLSWTSGPITDYGWGIIPMLENFCQSSGCNDLARACMSFTNDEDLASAAHNWLMLETAMRKGLVKDLYVRCGSDKSAFNIARRMGCTLTENFGWTRGSR